MTSLLFASGLSESATCGWRSSRERPALARASSTLVFLLSGFRSSHLTLYTLKNDLSPHIQFRRVGRPSGIELRTPRVEIYTLVTARSPVGLSPSAYPASMSPIALAEDKAADASISRPIHCIPIVQRAPPSRLRSGALFALFTLLLLGMHLS